MLSLRTGFNWEGIEEPRQMIYDEAELEFEVADVKGLPAGERKNASIVTLGLTVAAAST